MYIPPHFNVVDQNKIIDFIKSNAFGQLISQVRGRAFSTHMPFLLLEKEDKLIGHMAVQNPQHSVLEGQEALVTFQGPHDYISPNWYDSLGVPTWNYQAVHIYGHCRVFNDTDKLRDVVDTLTDKYEAAYDEPWQPDYNPLMLRGIVGIELTIEEIQCKYKLSQNRSIQDQFKVAEKLEAVGSPELANAMRALCKGIDGGITE